MIFSLLVIQFYLQILLMISFMMMSGILMVNIILHYLWNPEVKIIILTAISLYMILSEEYVNILLKLRYFQVHK